MRELDWRVSPDPDEEVDLSLWVQALWVQIDAAREDPVETFQWAPVQKYAPTDGTRRNRQTGDFFYFDTSVTKELGIHLAPDLFARTSKMPTRSEARTDPAGIAERIGYVIADAEGWVEGSVQPVTSLAYRRARGFCELVQLLQDLPLTVRLAIAADGVGAVAEVPGDWVEPLSLLAQHPGMLEAPTGVKLGAPIQHAASPAQAWISQCWVHHVVMMHQFRPASARPRARLAQR